MYRYFKIFVVGMMLLTLSSCSNDDSSFDLQTNCIQSITVQNETTYYLMLDQNISLVDFKVHEGGSSEITTQDHSTSQSIEIYDVYVTDVGDNFNHETVFEVDNDYQKDGYNAIGLVTLSKGTYNVQFIPNESTQSFEIFRLVAESQFTYERIIAPLIAMVIVVAIIVSLGFIIHKSSMNMYQYIFSLFKK